MSINNNVYLLLITIILILATTSLIHAGTIVGSKHDLSALAKKGVHTSWGVYQDYKQVCVYCHIPHNSNQDGGPLWNRPLPSANSYNLYESNTLDSSTHSINTQSLLCLSCHDGTIAVDAVLNQPMPDNADLGGHMNYEGTQGNCGWCHGGGTAAQQLGSFLSQDLSNDHPVSFTYDSTLASTDGSLKDPSVPSGLGGSIASDMLSNGQLECTSCHNVHDPQYGNFLIKESQNLCITCHQK